MAKMETCTCQAVSEERETRGRCVHILLLLCSDISHLVMQQTCEEKEKDPAVSLLAHPSHFSSSRSSTSRSGAQSATRSPS